MKARRDDTVSRQIEDARKTAMEGFESAQQRLRAVATSVTNEARELTKEARKTRSYPRMKQITVEDIEEYRRKKLAEGGGSQ